MADPSDVRLKVDALDEAYRRLKGRGGPVRLAWQQARASIIQGGSWDDLSGALMDELVAEAKVAENEAIRRSPKVEP